MEQANAEAGILAMKKLCERILLGRRILVHGLGHLHGSSGFLTATATATEGSPSKSVPQLQSLLLLTLVPVALNGILDPANTGRDPVRYTGCYSLQDTRRGGGVRRGGKKHHDAGAQPAGESSLTRGLTVGVMKYD